MDETWEESFIALVRKMVAVYERGRAEFIATWLFSWNSRHDRTNASRRLPTARTGPRHFSGHPATHLAEVPTDGISQSANDVQNYSGLPYQAECCKMRRLFGFASIRTLQKHFVPQQLCTHCDLQGVQSECIHSM